MKYLQSVIYQSIHTRIVLVLVLMASIYGQKANAQTDVTIEASSISRFVSSENGSEITANRTGANGAWEFFEVEHLSNGNVAFKGNNDKYISSENGTKAMRCDRDLGAWEAFSLESLGGSDYAIKGNNGKYVVHSQGTGDQLECTSSTISSLAVFTFTGLNSNNGNVDLCGGTLDPPLNWGDSYSVGSQCWCETNYDHGLDDVNEVSYVINGQARSIKSICEQLEHHNEYTAYNGQYPFYNDIQCGNGPANSDALLDEQCCPGIVGIGTAGCSQIGPKWDITWLEGRPIYNVTGYASIQTQSTGLFVSSEYGNIPMTANRDAVGTWETFGTYSNADGTVSFVGFNGEMVSSANGSSVMTCDEGNIGTTEKFTLVSYNGSSTVFGLLGSNGLYVTHSAGSGDQLICSGTSLGTNQRFVIASAGNPNLRLANPEHTTNELIDIQNVSVYPNPASNNVNIELNTNHSFSSYSMHSINGQVVKKGKISEGISNFSIDLSDIKMGIYMIKLDGNEFSKSIKISKN